MTAARGPAELLGAREATRLRPAEAIGPRAPMLATLTHRTFSDRNWVFERKLDGVRAIASRDGMDPDSGTILWSRNGNKVTAGYPEIAEALDAQAPERFVADGEVVAFDGAQTSFARLQHRMHLTNSDRARRTGVAVYFYLFDLLVLGDVDLTGLELRTRKRLLAECFGFTDPLRYSTHRDGAGRDYLDDACRRGWEGLIAKRAASPYRSGRSGDWLKLKCVRDQEFVIGGFTEPSGSRSGFAALLLGYYAGGRLRYAGKVGTGFDQHTLTELRRRLDELQRPDGPFDDRIPQRGVHWVEPELVAQIGFSEWTGDGLLRHPRFQGLRTDKRPRDVVRERR